MSCKKGTKQTPQAIIDQIIREHANGATLKELSIKYDKPFETIKKINVRENLKKRKIALGIVPKKRGRSVTNYTISDDDNKTSLRYKMARKDSLIKQLEMENELLRDFLKEIGRG